MMDRLLASIMSVGVDRAVEDLMQFEEIRNWTDSNAHRIHFVVAASVGALTYKMESEFDWNAYDRMGREDAERKHYALEHLRQRCSNALKHKITVIMTNQIDWSKA